MASLFDTEKTDQGPITEINITPLVDVMLVLLIIFMVTAKYFVEGLQINVALPEASIGELSEPQPLKIVINKEGAILCNGEQSTLELLGEKIDQLLKTNKNLKVIIGADKSVQHGKVIEVINFAGEHGVRRFGMMVQEKKKVHEN